MDVKRSKLKNGVDLTVVTDKKFKKDVMSVSFICGSGLHAASSSALLTGVLSRSCSKYPTLMELNRALDGLYDAQLTSDAGRRGLDHIPTFSVSSLCNRYSIDGTDIRGGCLDILYDIIFDPATRGSFDKKTVSSEKQQLKDSIGSIKNSRSSYALRRCTEILMRDTPDFAPRLGTQDGVDATDSTSLYEFYNYMISKAPVSIVSVSGEDDGRACEFADRLCSSLPDRDDGYVREAGSGPAKKRITREYEEANVSQDVLCVGCSYDGDMTDGRGAERALFHEIFFQNPTSRLFENVREKLSLCYYCTAHPMTDLKKLIIYAGVDGKKAAKAEAEIKAQLEYIKQGVTKEELERCRLALKNDLLALSDSPSRIASWYSVRALYKGVCDTVEDFYGELDRVTPEDVLHAARSVAPHTVFRLKGTENDA